MLLSICILWLWCYGCCESLTRLFTHNSMTLQNIDILKEVLKSKYLLRGSLIYLEVTECQVNALSLFRKKSHFYLYLFSWKPDALHLRNILWDFDNTGLSCCQFCWNCVSFNKPRKFVFTFSNYSNSLQGNKAFTSSSSWKASSSSALTTWSSPAIVTRRLATAKFQIYAG